MSKKNRYTAACYIKYMIAIKIARLLIRFPDMRTFFQHFLQSTFLFVLHFDFFI